MNWSLKNTLTISGKLLLTALVALLVIDWAAGRLLAGRLTSNNKGQSQVALFPAPYVMYATRPGSMANTSNIKINAQGFRHPVPVTLTRARPRVFINGASFAFGAGATDDSTCYVEQLRKRFPTIEFVIAAGGGGFTAIQEWINLYLNILPLEPDGIILVDGFTDIALPLYFGENPGNPFQWQINYSYMTGRPFDILRGYILQHSNLCRIWNRLRQDRRASNPQYCQDIFPKILSIYLYATSLSYEACQRRDIPVWHVFHPQLAVGKSQSAEEASFSLPGLNASIRRLYPKMAVALSDLAHEWRVPCYDMTLSMAGFPGTLYVDYAHLNDNGQAILGDKIADFLHANSFQEDVTASYRRRLNHVTHPTNNQPENGIVFPGLSSFPTQSDATPRKHDS